MVKIKAALLTLNVLCIFAAEDPEGFEKRFLLSKEDDRQLRLEKGRKWLIKKNVDGVNFVDRDTSPTKRVKVVSCSHEDHGDVCTSS
jgi:hypothetical protein